MPRALRAVTSRRRVRTSVSSRAASSGPVAEPRSCKASSSARTRSALVIRGQNMPCFGRSVCAMPYEPRHLTYLGRDGRFKHYGIGTHAPDPRPELVSSVRALVPAGETGFTIAHDARSAGLGLVYWWANENELHRAAYVSPLDSPAALTPLVDAGLACV